MTKQIETVKVTVVVPPRLPHTGFWSLGQSRPGAGVFFPSGKTKLEVTADELAELKADEAKGFLAVVD